MWADDSKYPGCAAANRQLHPPAIGFLQGAEFGVLRLTAGPEEQDTLRSCVGVSIRGVPAVGCGEQVSIEPYGLC